MKGKALSVQVVAAKILMIRGKRVMLDRDLAELYKVPTGVLNQAVKRNRSRFPEDFMFGLTKDEFAGLISQFVISKRGGTRKLPNVFTEHGVTMLSCVLNSERAIQVNISIVRAFVWMRETLLTHKELVAKIESIELKYKNHDGKIPDHDAQIAAIFEAIRQLMSPPAVPEKPRIGF